MEHHKQEEFLSYYKRTGLPFVTLKTAMTLDGKIATATGDSKWITNESSRENVHYMRHWNDAIMVGIGTVLKDRPKLTTRLPEGNGKNPTRIVADSLLRIPRLNSIIYKLLFLIIFLLLIHFPSVA